MYDVAIIGAGPRGLALAEMLEAQCRSALGGEALARCCLLAMPPPLVACPPFAPAADGATLSALRQTPARMANSAKAGRAVWRDAGLSGSAFAAQDQSARAELWDCCDATGERAGPGARVECPQGANAVPPDANPCPPMQEWRNV